MIVNILDEEICTMNNTSKPPNTVDINKLKILLPIVCKVWVKAQSDEYGYLELTIDPVRD